MSSDLEYIKNAVSYNLGEKELINFIKTAESNVYNGTDEDGNTITVGIQKNVGFRISTYQSNGWIRINNYELVTDDEGNPYIQTSETYEK